ncbi:MAG: YHS domain-containing protein [Actinobacteria bacterium]|nr:YHS domain-containing protein [Actinomycetota bacterium]
MAKCVVCAAMGMDTTVDEEDARRKGLTYDYKGRTYYLDSQEHLNMLKEDPERYIKIALERGWAA